MYFLSLVYDNICVILYFSCFNTLCLIKIYDIVLERGHNTDKVDRGVLGNRKVENTGFWIYILCIVHNVPFKTQP
jgi:hypothetical protein